MKTLIVTALLLTCPLAHAARYCHAPEELEARVETCDENAYYAEAAVLCVESFKAKVDKAAGRTGKALDKAVGKMKSAQDQNFDTTGNNYQLSEAVLSQLIAEGEARLAEADAYLDEVVFPEDAGEGGGDASEELKNTSCYQRNVDVIGLVKRDFGKKLAELKAARTAAASLRGVSDGREQNLDASLPSNADVPTTQAAPAGTPRTGKDYRPSDITGTEKLKKKK